MALNIKKNTFELGPKVGTHFTIFSYQLLTNAGIFHSMTPMSLPVLGLPNDEDHNDYEDLHPKTSAENVCSDVVGVVMSDPCLPSFRVLFSICFGYHCV